MWRSAFGLCAILAASSAGAQQSLDNALHGIEAFDCVAEGERTLYVFQMGNDGQVSLLGEEAAPVRIEGAGYSIMLEDGAREISTESYFVYRDGAASSGTCSQVSELVRASYSVITNGLIPEVDADSVDASGQAAAVMVQAMQGDLAAADAETADLDAALASAEAELTKMQVAAETASDSLAKMQASEEATRAELADALGAVASFRVKLSEIAAQLSEAESGRMTATEMFDDATTELTELKADYASEVDASAALRAELAAITGVLDATEQERRSVVANVAILNQQMSDLGGQLNAARGAATAAENSANSAKAQIGAMSNLAKAALAQVATIQGRSVTAVRREVCSLMNGARPSVCR